MSQSPNNPFPAAPSPERILRPRHGLIAIDFGELWRYRELFAFLAWRDILIRYKQTAIGVGWALIQPLVPMVVFTLVFGRLAKLPSNGAPYAVMTFAALLPWQFFANAMSSSSQSLVASQHMITKVYFPRLIIPGSATISGASERGAPEGPEQGRRGSTAEERRWVAELLSCQGRTNSTTGQPRQLPSC